MEDGGLPPGAYDEYIGVLGEMLQASSGVQRKQIEAQIRDAEQGRRNQMAIARLQSETSRYGVDAQRETALAQLKENQRQFDLTHGLEMQKFGLNYALAETEFLSTPDRYAQGADFRAAAARMLGPGGGPAPYGADTDFQAKTPQDFSVLANKYSGQQNPVAAPGGTSPNTGPTPYQVAASQSSGGGATQAASGGGSGGGTDPRVATLTTMFKQMPPSREDGMDANDFAVMEAAKAIMSTNLKPGSLESMRPDQRSILASHVKRSGRSWNDYVADYQRYGVGQKSPMQA
jgi:hypothetical protein